MSADVSLPHLKNRPWRKCIRHVRKKLYNRRYKQWVCILECGHGQPGMSPDSPHTRRRCQGCEKMGVTGDHNTGGGDG